MLTSRARAGHADLEKWEQLGPTASTTWAVDSTQIWLWQRMCVARVPWSRLARSACMTPRTRSAAQPTFYASVAEYFAISTTGSFGTESTDDRGYVRADAPCLAASVRALFSDPRSRRSSDSPSGSARAPRRPTGPRPPLSSTGQVALRSWMAPARPPSGSSSSSRRAARLSPASPPKAPTAHGSRRCKTRDSCSVVGCPVNCTTSGSTTSRPGYRFRCAATEARLRARRAASRISTASSST